MRPYAIRSYSHERFSDPSIRNADKDTTDISLVDACRATSASPTYFAKAEIRQYGSFSDGSLWAVNPAGEVYREIQDLNAAKGARIHAFLSIGYAKPRRRGSNMDNEAPHPYAVERTAHDETDDMLRRRQEAERFKYNRWVCPTSSGHTGDLDKLFHRLEDQTMAYCATIQPELRDWADFLVDVRRRRARTTHWETYVGFARPCPLCPHDKVMLAPQALQEHLQTRHRAHHDPVDVHIDGRQNITTSLPGKSLAALMAAKDRLAKTQ